LVARLGPSGYDDERHAVALVPVLAAAFAAAPAWQDSVMVSALTDQYVERPPAQSLAEELWSCPVVAGDGYAALLNSAYLSGNQAALKLHTAVR